MKYQKVKIALIALCILAAGLCYGMNSSREDRTPGISLSEASAFPYGENAAGIPAADDGSPADGNPSGIGVQAAGGAEVSGGAGQSASEAAEDSLESAGEIIALPFYVHICGEVVSPGVYELQEGSRVFQAIEKAGGFTDQAEAEYLNMAERVFDGMKIQVLNKEEAEAARTRGELSLPAAASSKALKTKVNLNTATKEELMTLRGIGEAKADDILKYRESRGGFQKIEDIMKISGIKDAAFQKIKEDISV
ncbi:helix-hairpin-helix domain-containing protein [Lacrimispora saccharolytica]|uniref:Competence protein ComEA helix-hairpin-helix repeat protein n=1 Tax=Lacrimispora saccharolytica (strain ATCC 35040 / DSM 2544 / NRCC 2533 / WM1) TaxID=610130 RepID=D9R8R5_LACSW|nr:helix-hairpin-helix domain-containing protein [Lacrimispora saccharolytica]ADL05794.1 competence protein ComEA helix-hairpin-helix repeat protein [[Clostridium] saccharolyticum WM1]QRV20068.1 helix-hairpin-helix domain-containing protein [Lacrimispora saccharolytica]